MTLDRLTVVDFAPLVGETFGLDAGEGGRLEVELASAKTFTEGAPAQDADGRRTPFSIHFRGPVDPLLPQQIYRVAHERLGALEIFLVPIGRDESATLYEAVFA